MELQAVGFAIVFGRQLYPAVRIDAEDPAPRNVHHPQVALAVEGRAFQDHRRRRPMQLRARPVAGTAAQQGMFGNTCEYFSLQLLRRCVHGVSCVGQVPEMWLGCLSASSSQTTSISNSRNISR